MLIKRLLIALLLLFPAKGFAADSTVAALAAASALAGSELFYCVQSSADKKCTASQISTFVLSTFPATTCTNQFVRSIAATTGAGTCASVASADLSALAGQYPGTAGNTAASAGNIGEYISSNIAAGSAVSLTTGTAANVTSVPLTAGDWDCRGNVLTNPNAATTSSAFFGWISATSATFPTAPNAGAYVQVNAAAAGQPYGQPVGTSQFIVNTTTTVFLSALVNFAINTNAAYGFLGCRRVH